MTSEHMKPTLRGLASPRTSRIGLGSGNHEGGLRDASQVKWTRWRGILRTSLTALALLALTSCGGSGPLFAPLSPVVHASTPDCSPERFYGDVSGRAQQPTETADYLQLATPACVITADATTSYVLAFDHLVQAADMQMGSNTGSELEWAFWVDFRLPSGRSFSLFGQYDKHQDVSGNRHEWRTFPVPIHLPAGTVVTIRRPALPAGFCTHAGPWGDTQACATGQKVELVGTLQ